MRITEVIQAQELPSGWLYHATAFGNLEGILRRGLRAGAKRRANFQGYEDWAKGKIFFASTPAGALRWFEMLYTMTYKAPVMLRVPARDVEIDYYADTVPGSVYVEALSIPVKEVQVWHPVRGWMPLSAAYQVIDEPRQPLEHQPPEEAF